MKKLLLLYIAFFCLFIYAKGPKIGEINYSFEQQHLLVSFDLAEGAVSPEVIEAIDSTKPITFIYEIEVAKKRFAWFDKTTHSKVVEKTVTYDNLTHQYDVVTKIDDTEKEKVSLASIDEVKDKICKIENIDTGSVVDLSPGEKTYYVRVRATLLKGFFLWIIPSDVDTGWMEKDLKTP
jgi:hypothetical protein